MQTRKLAFLTASLLAAAMLWGCGSSGSGGSDVAPTPTPGNVQTLGVDNCLTCHLDGAGSTGAVWLANIHGNPNAQPTAALSDPACLTCHDQLGDGQLLAGATNGVEANRPVVSCESCHGGGSAHRGVGILPFAKPGFERCGQCHNEDFPHTFAPEGVGIAEDFSTSPHTRSLNEHVFVEGTTDVRARCAKCHSDEGAKLYKNVDGDYAALSAALPNTAAPLKGAGAMDCHTCHQPHQEQVLLEGETLGVGGSVLRSAEFNTCTNCHQLVKNDLTKIIAYHDPAANPFGAADEIITDTHFATPGNFVSANTNDITGYAMDFSDNRVCRNCHNPHNADNTINEQWAESKHADKSAAGAWAHYNWTEIPGAVRNDGSVVAAFGDRRPCQRCHTTSGVIAYLTANQDGDASDYVAPLAYDANYKPEMLHCNGCHSNNLGALRETAAVTADYTNAPFTYPDAEGSNMCIACHTGRESGDSIKNSTADFTNTGFINSHYLTAGGTVYAATGYEYDADGDPATDDYANVSFFAHDKIGTVDEPGTGSNGACIGCHLSSPESHSFQPVERDETTGLITAVTSTVCAVCHAGNFELTAAELNEEEESFHASLDALAAQLAAVGHPFLGNYPYFAAGDWTNGGAFNGMNLMGAAFNYNLLEHDPGAYAHNRFYAKRLLYDSIDYADNALLDESVNDAIDVLVTSAALDATEAALVKAYLDGDSAAAGVQRP